MSTIRLRPYQQDCVSLVLSEILTESDDDRRCAIVIPTGGGKTMIGTYLARTLWCEHGLRTAIVTPNHHIAEQWFKKLETYLPPELLHRGHRIGSADDGQPEIEPVCVASVWQSLPPELAARYQLLIVDEAHHAPAATWQTWLERFSSAYTLGMTATPIRGDGICITQSFGKIIYAIDLRELINLGELPDVRGWRVSTGVDLSAVPIVAGDYQQSALGRRVDTPDRNAIVVEAYRRWGENRPGLIFCVNRAHADTLARDFTAAGYPCRSVHGGLKKAKITAILRDFAEGRLHLLTTCRILLEGYDAPRAEVVVLARPFTAISARVELIQALGRALRNASGKLYAILIQLLDEHARSRPGTAAEVFDLPVDFDPQGALLAAEANRLENQVRCERRCDLVDAIGGGLLQAHRAQTGWAPPRLTQPFESIDVLQEVEEAMGLPCVTSGEYRYLSLVDGCSVLFDRVAGGLYRSTYRAPDGRPATFTIAETWEQALAATSQRLLGTCGSRVLQASRADARWRHDPQALATPNQVRALQRYGVDARAIGGLTKGEASNLLTYLIANQAVHHRPPGNSGHP